MSEAPATPEGLFARHPAGLAVWERVAQLAAALPGTEVRTSRSQVALRRRRAFAFVWRPGQYVRSDVPAVLSIALDRELDSARFKEVAHPGPRIWMHHLEVRDPAEVDDEVAGWLREAWARAG
ncbi:unannotated protein [freshwater metagenome]|uniref:Unannotated protein n=1 Tax=freshwater metagenome TaxID=449393 RepID=A0A6J6S1H1_9ZZZZ|nr:hypothetical protein [Actinomycetota bacterium]